MIYTLRGKHCKAGNEGFLFYDSEKHVLLDSLKNPIKSDLWQMNRTLRVGKKIRLLMGTNCNMNCSYCSQVKTNIAYTINDCEKILPVLDKIQEPISVIEFWGGEPLVYFKYIQMLVRLIRSNSKYDSTQFAIITNGYLLTDKIVDFLIVHRFRIQISYDGKNQKNRSDVDYLAFKVKQIKRLLNDPYMRANRCICFASVLLQNTNLEELQNYFIELFGEPVILQPIPLLYMREELLKNKFTNDQHRELLTKTFNTAIQDTNIFTCQTQSNEIACSLLHANGEEAGRPCVTADEKDVVIDLHGNIFLCQNYARQENIIGNLIQGDYFDIKKPLFKHFSCCDKCILHWCCHGACRILDGELFVETCKSYFYYYLGMFVAAIFKITGVVITDIENLTLPEFVDNSIKTKIYSSFKVIDYAK